MQLIILIKFLKIFFDTTFEQKIAQLLLEKGKTLAIAESCTGGLLSSLFTDVSGSSGFIKANFVTYANEAKHKYLNVKEDTLNTYGAVSTQTATEMAQGVLKETGADFALATTGIAGPTGGTDEKPVGTIFIGIAMGDKTLVHKFNTNPKYPRLLIKYLFAKQAIKKLYEFIKEQNL